MTTYVPYDEQAAAPAVSQIPSSGAPQAQAAPTPGGYVPYEEKAYTPSELQKPAVQRTLQEDASRQFGLFLRHAITGITGTGAAIGDFGVGAANLMGAKLPMPSQEQDKMLTRLGLPQPEGLLEKSVGVGTSMLAGGMDPALNATQKAVQQLAPAGFQAAQDSAKANGVQVLRQAGYQLPPVEMDAGRVARSMEGIGGSKRIVTAMEGRNQAISQDLARQGLGLAPGEPLTRETLQRQAADLITTGYEPIRNIPLITIGSQYRNALKTIANDLGGSDSFPLASRDEVKGLVNSYLKDAQGRYVQSYTGADALKEIKLLRQSASQNFKPGGDPLLGTAQNKIATVLEDNIETSMRSYGPAQPLLERFREARKALARNYAVERMLVDADTGVIDTTKAHALLNSKDVPLDGPLRTIALAGSPMFRRATGVPTAGGGWPVTTTDTFMGGAGLSAAHFGNGFTGSLIAGLPVARGAMRAAVQTEPMQNMMARNMQRGPSMFGAPADRVMAATPEQIIPLFSQGQQ